MSNSHKLSKINFNKDRAPCNKINSKNWFDAIYMSKSTNWWCTYTWQNQLQALMPHSRVNFDSRNWCIWCIPCQTLCTFTNVKIHNVSSVHHVTKSKKWCTCTCQNRFHELIHMVHTMSNAMYIHTNSLMLKWRTFLNLNKGYKFMFIRQIINQLVISYLFTTPILYGIFRFFSITFTKD